MEGETQPNTSELFDRPPMRQPPAGEATVGELVDRLEELVKYTLECEQKKMRDDVSFVDIYRQLLEIRGAISVLTKEQEDLLHQVTVAAALPESDIPFTEEDRKVLSKIKHLQDICETARERLHTAIQKNPETERELQEQILESMTPPSKKKTRRKGKFRPLGGKEGWIPT
jgi:hypothetical protein